ncbi:preprotein translocase subunit SecG [Marilutibacter maris]|uniref:Protein-export membrane protein SecG n=1 Tax=Marilutibacter maris TaxID=1605891 RepID=A0A2U9TFM4_9GAMM|nr:preprotein translocase subunit SecG [Lysobacter maris]AWV07050.1 preprotein translocase subunit SecG [Lysobacter maris]KAB8196918.1 preprotein translocase subunit SecG [Lysobacter maris]
MLILNVIFVLVAIAMIALILMQRGAGAQAGSGFGGGASATVFGARGSASFLTKATKWLAVVFFVITFFMAWQATHGARQADAPDGDLGLMTEVPAAPQADDAAVPAAAPSIPEAPSSAAGEQVEVPAAEAPAEASPAPQPEEAVQAPVEGN